MSKYRGRIPIVDQFNPDAWGKDDITGLPVMHGDMVKQMEFIGNGLAWTGMMVHHKDADEPNPQLMPPIIPPDPVPIRNPRILQFLELPDIPTGLMSPSNTSTTIDVTWNAVIGAQSYVLEWGSIWNTGTATITAVPNVIPTYTIPTLAAETTYGIAVATVILYPPSTSPYMPANELIGQSAFSDPILVTTQI